MSFINATLVLSIGETVEEVTDSGFLGTTPTLSCSQLGEDALLQVGGWGQLTSCMSSRISPRGLVLVIMYVHLVKSIVVNVPDNRWVTGQKLSCSTTKKEN